LAAGTAAPRVIYANSFNKLLFPSLRLGYLIVPASLLELFARAALELQVSAGVPNQVVLAEFIRGGHLDRHLRTARAAYAARRKRLIALLEQELAGLLEVQRRPVGLHLTARLRRGSEAEWIGLAAELGVHLVGMSRFTASPAEPAVLFGFAGFDVAVLQAAAARLGQGARNRFGPR
jgi:GntR family transcriptional regulator / MocR family aminotransferase